MGNEAPRLRVVGSAEGPRPRRPGPAVVSVLLFALLFVGALWYLRTRSPLFQQKNPAGSAAIARVSARSQVEAPGAPSGVVPPPVTRDALLSGEALPRSARSGYFRRLATDRCDCGCERTLSDCLANEKSCSRSPAIAGKAWQRAAEE